MQFGVYIHFPYCLSKCPYCDFASRAEAVIPQRRYTDAVLRELATRAAQFPGREAISIYFGGGTPSLWDPPELGRVDVQPRRVEPQHRRRAVELHRDADLAFEARLRGVDRDAPRIGHGHGAIVEAEARRRLVVGEAKSGKNEEKQRAGANHGCALYLQPLSFSA